MQLLVVLVQWGGVYRDRDLSNNVRVMQSGTVGSSTVSSSYLRCEDATNEYYKVYTYTFPTGFTNIPTVVINATMNFVKSYSLHSQLHTVTRTNFTWSLLMVRTSSDFNSDGTPKIAYSSAQTVFCATDNHDLNWIAIGNPN